MLKNRRHCASDLSRVLTLLSSTNRTQGDTRRNTLKKSITLNKPQKSCSPIFQGCDFLFFGVQCLHHQPYAQSKAADKAFAFVQAIQFSHCVFEFSEQLNLVLRSCSSAIPTTASTTSSISHRSSIPTFPTCPPARRPQFTQALSMKQPNSPPIPLRQRH